MRMISTKMGIFLHKPGLLRKNTCYLRTMINRDKPLTKNTKIENLNSVELDLSEEGDFFGIKDGLKYVSSSTAPSPQNKVVKFNSNKSMVDKYNHLNGSKDRNVNKELCYEMPYGSIRFDQTEMSNEQKKLSSRNKPTVVSDTLNIVKDVPYYVSLNESDNLSEIDKLPTTLSNYVDEQYFSPAVLKSSSDNIKMQVDSSSSHIELPVENQRVSNEPLDVNQNLYTNVEDEKFFGPLVMPTSESNKSQIQFENGLEEKSPSGSDYIDKMFFSHITEKEKAHENEISSTSGSINENTQSIFDNKPANIFEDQYFHSNISQPEFSKNNQSDAPPISNNFKANLDPLQTETTFSYKTKPKPDFEIKHGVSQDVEQIERHGKKTQTEKYKTSTRRIKEPSFKENKNSPPENAFEIVKQMRTQKMNEEKFKTKPYNAETNHNDQYEETITLGNINQQMRSKKPDLSKLLNSEVLAILKNSIVYNDNDIVALNKPYGITCQGGDPKSRVWSVTKFLDDIAKFAKCESGKLYLTHRLDKDCSGVLLLAKTQTMAKVLSDMFAEHQIEKKYYAFCNGIPSHQEGIIDIPICEGSIATKYRMVLSPEIKDKDGIVKKFSSTDVKPAVTRYKVLQTQTNTSLIEVTPKTGFKHQIRVHLGFGIGCPIIGDHKYSYLKKIVPQRLPGDVLDRLGIKQSKVRDLPMHLHAMSIMLPELAEGQNIFIQAKLPIHFTKSLHLLKYKKK